MAEWRVLINHHLRKHQFLLNLTKTLVMRELVMVLVLVPMVHLAPILEQVLVWTTSPVPSLHIFLPSFPLQAVHQTKHQAAPSTIVLKVTRKRYTDIQIIGPWHVRLAMNFHSFQTRKTFPKEPETKWKDQEYAMRCMPAHLPLALNSIWVLADADQRTSVGVTTVSNAQKNKITTRVLSLICGENLRGVHNGKFGWDLGGLLFSSWGIGD